MAASIPASGISLHGAVESEENVKPGSSSAILFNLNDSVLQDLRKASHAKDGLHFVTGGAPKLRIGSRTIDLSIGPDAFRNELFASTTSTSSTNFTFTGIVSHRAELKPSERKSNSETPGSDAALAALQSTLASYEEEKRANQTNITNSVLPAPKSRFDAAKNEKQGKNRSFLSTNNISRTLSPSLSAVGTPRLGPGPTSAPASEDEVKTQAMKTPVIHLLAMKPTTSEDIIKKTHIPKDDLDHILQKVGKQGQGKWLLGDRAYKDLDVWKFGYQSRDDRQSAIDNAIKAYDRMRLGKDEKLWQMLLPKGERGKGKVLSRLHLGGGQVNRGLTPSYQPSPMPHDDGAGESRPVSAANTPRLGASTPRTGSSAGDVRKRLLSKDPKKARAVEEAKEKKKKEREAAAEVSDREGGRPVKKQATKRTNPNIKSAEFVDSSDEESADQGEAKDGEIDKPSANPASTKATTKARPKAKSSTSPESGETTEKRKPTEKPAAKSKSTTAAATEKTSPVVKASKPTGTGRNTPQTNSGLAAPTSQHKSQRSPQKPDSRPSVPSPLGAARPRVASDVSDRGAVGVQRVRQETETPKGLGISNGARKRQDTITSNGSIGPSTSDKKGKEQGLSEKQQKTTMNDASAPKTSLTNGVSHKTEGGTKRKAEGSPSQRAEDAPANKHRKTESTSAQSQKSQTSSSKASNSTARTSPDGPLDGSSSDSAGSVLDSITYAQGVSMAEKFRDNYYPVYGKLYDEQAATEARGEKVSKEERERLWAMHRRLEQMKREIVIASHREE